MLYNFLSETFKEAFLEPTEDEGLKGKLWNYIFLLGIFSIKSISKSHSKGKYVCIVYNNNRDRIQSHIEDIFGKYHTHVGDWCDSYQQKCIQYFNWCSVVAYKNWQPHQLRMTCNSVIQHFDDYVSSHQIHQETQHKEPASSLKWWKTDENLIIMCLLDNFPGISKSSSVMSQSVAFTRAVQI